MELRLLIVVFFLKQFFNINRLPYKVLQSLNLISKGDAFALYLLFNQLTFSFQLTRDIDVLLVYLPLLQGLQRVIRLKVRSHLLLSWQLLVAVVLEQKQNQFVMKGVGSRE